MLEDKELRELALELLIRADEYNFSYQWNWLGLPIIQLPNDIVALQEIIWNTRPSVIVETGIARGGSLVFMASILELIGHGKVVGVDIDIREHNRRRIESHPMFHRIELVEGSSTSEAVIDAVRSHIEPHDRVMVILDSDHTHSHVLDELRLYGPLVTLGQYLIVADTVVEEIPTQEHRPRPWGPGNNPMTALLAYVDETDRFETDEYLLGKLIETSSPGGYLKCVR